MNIFQTIKNETVNSGNKTAVINGSRTVTYAELISFAETIAASLKESGVRRHDRVALLCRDSMEYIASSLAVLHLSAVLVPVGIEHTETEINEILGSISVNYLLFEEGNYNSEGADRFGSDDFSGKEFYIVKCGSKVVLPEEYYNINPAFIRFSSGTTGRSKGIVLSHEAIIERTDAADRGLNITSDDIVLWVLSMSFHFVVTILLFLRRAATIVLCSDHFPEALVEGIEEHKGTFIYASPFHYNLLALSDLISSAALGNIRLAVSTAMKLPEDVAGGFYNKFNLELSEAYGIIEVGLPFINLSSDESKRSSVGRALPDYELEIANKDKAVVGQIHIKGKGMLDAYFSPWQNRADILRNGWFNTGDLGKIDEQGYLTIVGRDKDVINFAGMKVFPNEVESVINQFPAIKESLVYGEKHAQYDQLPAAKIVLKKGVQTFLTEDLRRFCYQKLAQYKVPKSFEIADGLPMTKSGKIKR